jgi:hypothetical protein
MTLVHRVAVLPARLRSAVRIWLGIAVLSVVMPASAVASIGILAQPWFWAGLLPLLAMLPFQRELFPGSELVDPRQQRNLQEFMRHTRAPALKPATGHLGA